MKCDEMSNMLDTLLNSYATIAGFGKQASNNEVVLDEYEKSVILTQAQDIIVKSYFDGRYNAGNEGFDDTTRRQVDFSSLITTATLEKSEDQSTIFDDRGIIYTMPLRGTVTDGSVWDYTFDDTFRGIDKSGQVTDVLFILNEKLETVVGSRKKTYVVVPINYKEYDREMSKPYAQPLKKQAWRLLQNVSQGFDIKTELIPRWDLEGKEEIRYYKIRYVRRPYPIVLVDLPDGLNIDGFTKQQECELNPILHPDVLQKAVEIALQTRFGFRPQQQSQQ